MHTRVGWGVRVWVGARVRGSGRAASDDAPRTSAASDAGLKCGEQRAGVCVCVCGRWDVALGCVGTGVVGGREVGGRVYEGVVERCALGWRLEDGGGAVAC